MVARLFGGLIMLALIGSLGGCVGNTPISESNYKKLRVGMNFEKVQDLLGKGGKDITPDEVAEIFKKAYPVPGSEGTPSPAGKAAPKINIPDPKNLRGVRWGNEKKNITILFQDDQVLRYTKTGL